MCGICVAVSDEGPVDRALVHDMCERIAHRGPDAEGLYAEGRVGLGMRRLSIIDVEGGHQPIYNEDRTKVIVFNGEIYNHRALREELAARGHRFATSSDTEAIVHGYEEWGDGVVTRLRGMFAFAICDRVSGRVLLARDRLGIKPLHWVEQGGALYAASELKSLRAVPGLALTLDEVALDQYLSLLYVPAPRTIFREVRKLPPGHVLVKEPGAPAVVRRYWRLEARPDEGPSEAEWLARVRAAFDDAVRSHLVADVPLGAFLSGGVDSSAIVAAMARVAGGRVKTFSLGFPAEYSAFDERRFARKVAARYETDHEELEVAPDVEEAIHALGRSFDEPHGDSGAVPNLLVCRLARRRLTVALSGLGGDELSGGYQRYLGVLVGEWYRRIPGFLRQSVVRRLVELVPESPQGARSIDQAKRFVRGGELPWLERFFAFSSPLERERRRALYTPALRERVRLDSAFEHLKAFADEQADADLVNKLLCVDQQTYMVDDLLTVADRTSMAASLEVRVPFLDHPLVELMARVPGRFKIRRGEKKRLLKRAFAADLPREILYRKKAGFSLPVARWLREELRGLVEEYLGAERLRRQGWFEPAVVETLKTEHATRARNNGSALWALLMLQLWAEEYYR
ncbi:MAG TPA: asparagine synthase (glutamine-hydrolyzing) [Polyangia bacterium]|nr:asparagine synthase (glutamine-hydrolyzing) [Polyangia bacterium]